MRRHAFHHGGRGRQHVPPAARRRHDHHRRHQPLRRQTEPGDRPASITQHLTTGVGLTDSFSPVAATAMDISVAEATTVGLPAAHSRYDHDAPVYRSRLSVDPSLQRTEGPSAVFGPLQSGVAVAARGHRLPARWPVQLGPGRGALDDRDGSCVVAQPFSVSRLKSFCTRSLARSYGGSANTRSTGDPAPASTLATGARRTVAPRTRGR